MARAPLNEYYSGRLLGQFRHAEMDVTFEYSMVRDRPFGNEYGYAVWMRDGVMRYAKILKTVAYVVVDEADDGSAITERWKLRGHREYAT